MQLRVTKKNEKSDLERYWSAWYDTTRGGVTPKEQEKKLAFAV